YHNEDGFVQHHRGPWRRTLATRQSRALYVALTMSSGRWPAQENSSAQPCNPFLSFRFFQKQRLDRGSDISARPRRSQRAWLGCWSIRPTGAPLRNKSEGD